MTKFLCICALALAAAPAESVAAATAPPGAAATALPTARASITLHLHAPPERALPMFDPVNESRWSPAWSPTLLGDGRVATGLVFTTAAEHGRATWLLDRYDALAHEVRYVVFLPQMLTTIDIAVVPDGANASIAMVAYTRTALDATAAASVEHFARAFPSQGPHWESAINAALDGKPIP